MSAFHDRLRALKSEGSTAAVVDLGKVNLISSSGVGALVGGAKTLREAGGDLKLANLSERTHNVLVVITRLGSVFQYIRLGRGCRGEFLNRSRSIWP